MLIIYRKNACITRVNVMCMCDFVMYGVTVETYSTNENMIHFLFLCTLISLIVMI